MFNKEHKKYGKIKSHVYLCMRFRLLVKIKYGGKTGASGGFHVTATNSI